jgi:hypothetical protein
MLSERVVSGDRELERAEAEAGAERFGEGHHRTVVGRVGELREHPDDHRKVRVEMSGIVARSAVRTCEQINKTC